jgi:Glycosyltransferase family 87
MQTEELKTSRPPSRLCINLAIILWSIAFLALCGRTLVLKVDTHSVFPVFTSAARNWLNGTDLYVRGRIEDFRYSPIIAAFFVPFDLLPIRVGEFLWRSLNFAVLVGGMLYCCRVGLPRRLTLNQQAAVFLLALPMSVGSLNNAQSNPLVIGLMLIAVAAVMEKRWTLCTTAITIATLFKIYPLSVGLLLLLLYPARIGWRLLVCLAVGILLPFVLQRTAYVLDQYKIWARYLSAEDRQRGPISDWYRDFRAMWRVYVSPMSMRHYLMLELAVAAIIALICLMMQRKHWPTNRVLTMLLSLACCWMTVLGPATESATYILLAPIVAWALVQTHTQPSAWLRRIGYELAYGLFLASQCALWFGKNGRWFRDQLQPLPIAGTLLLVLLLIDGLLAATSQNVSMPAFPLADTDVD